MSGSVRHFWSLLLLLSSLAPASAAESPGEVRAPAAPRRSGEAAAPPDALPAGYAAASPISQLVLLRNGEVLEGQVSRVGDRYVIALSDGKIQIRAGDVETVCRDLAECYRFKRERIAAGNVHDFLALGEWCLRNDLTSEAAAAFQAAAELDPKHPKLAVLERRLQLALTPAAPAPAAPAKTAETIPTEVLERTVRSLPPKSVEHFTLRVQPLLLNNCSSGGCHSAQSPTTFRLLRLPSNRVANRRSTERNLSATLALVDREHPGASPLLTVPIKPHGASAAPIFGAHQSNQYQQLLEWVALVTGRPVQFGGDGDEETSRRSQPASRQANAADWMPFADGPSSQVPLESGGAGKPAAGPGRPAKIADRPIDAAPPTDPLERRKPIQRGAPASAFVPQDEFDPAIFNRGPAPAGAP